jgi:hypothetical protein
MTISHNPIFGSWAIFHIVGANPAMKSKPSLLRLPLFDLMQLFRSNVQMVPSYHLPAEV